MRSLHVVALAAIALLGIAPTSQRLALVVAKLVDTEGNPISGAQVRLVYCRGPRMGGSSGVPTLGASPPPESSENCEETIRTSDEAGEARFPSVRVGMGGTTRREYTYVLNAFKEGYSSAGDLITPHPARNDYELVMMAVDPGLMALSERARAEAEAGRYAEAAATMRQVVDLVAAEGSRSGFRAPRALVDVIRSLAYLEVQAGSDIASQTVEELLRREPYDPFGRRLAGILAIRARDWQAAASHFDLLVLLQPESAESWLFRGGVFVETGDHEEAIEYLERAREIDPGAATIHRALGMAHAAAGSRAEAVASLERYLELAGDSADAGQIRDLIEELRND